MAKNQKRYQDNHVGLPQAAYPSRTDLKDKPIHLKVKGHIGSAYIRRGGEDESCTESELRAFIRDASDTSYDRSLERVIDAEKFFNPQTLKWYRNRLDKGHTDKYAHLDDLEFLLEMGLLIEEGEKLVPTKAAVLLFGKDRFVRQVLSRPVVDYQRIDYTEDNWNADTRWHDRLVIESNLFEAWRMITDKYSLIVDIPFSLDVATLQRKDDSLEFRSFREAAMNLLIHQDYSDFSRKATIKIFKDKTVFWNPGSAYLSVDELLESRQCETRNPLIVRVFRQIGLCEEAGTGIRTIMEDCRKLGLIPAQIVNDRTRFSFSIAILKTQIISESVRDLLSKMKLQLDVDETALFSYLVSNDSLSLPMAKAITGRSGEMTSGILAKLEDIQVLKFTGYKQAWSLSEEMVQKITEYGAELETGQADVQETMQATMQADQATMQAHFSSEDIAQQGDKLESVSENDQADMQETMQATMQVTMQATMQAQEDKKQKIARLINGLTQIQIGIIRTCTAPTSTKEIVQSQKLVNRNHIRMRHIKPLLEQGILLMEYPDKTSHPKQRYYLSELGKEVLQALQLR